MSLYTIGEMSLDRKTTHTVYHHVLFPSGLKRVEKCTRKKIVLEKFLRTGVEGLTYRERRTSDENSGSTRGWVLPWAEGYHSDQITCCGLKPVFPIWPPMSSSPRRTG